ncbi:MAG: hypothetical protein RJA22_2362 [Verrucomicrobiota bacterium]
MDAAAAPAAGFPWLTCLTLLPLVGAILIAGLPSPQPALARRLGLACQAAALLLTLWIVSLFQAGSGDLQFVERHDWIPTVGVQYHLGLDGLSLVMVLLTALIPPFALLASGRVTENPRAFVALLLFLQAGLFGAFTALNFIHWFLFYELSLIPAYFLVKLWGGPRRVAAANQFFVYTMVGSVALLLSMLAVYLVTGSFDLIELAARARTQPLEALFNVRIEGWYSLSPRTLALVLFAGAFLGFAVKVPVWPFHTWLPDTYSEAPTGVSMILTGVMSKLGLYGMLRILLPLFPEPTRWVLDGLLLLAVATIVLAALAALAQRDLKRMVAYSSINHLGYCLLGVFAAAQLTGGETRWTQEKAAALNGVILQMFNHGLTAAALFFFVGLLEERTGRRGLGDFGGLRRIAPVFCGLMGITLFASLGLPGLNGFVGEFLIFKGAFPLSKWAALLSLPGLLVTAVFLLNILQRVWSGPPGPQAAAGSFPDLTLRERLIAAPAVALMLFLGLWPQALLQFINPTVRHLVGQLAP